MIFNAARNPFLLETTGVLRGRAMPFRRGQFVNPSRLAQSLVEHSRVVNAILAGDAEAAGREMRSHLLSARAAAADVTGGGPALQQVLLVIELPAAGGGMPPRRCHQCGARLRFF